MVMAQPVQHWNLGIGPISCHAWNKERTQVAVSPSSNEIHIFEWRGGRWECIHVLLEHDLPVTGIDWARDSNRIVSCSQDKNAFVWTYDSQSKSWKPELVLVRINRAATCVKWSPQENKFAVGSGAKLISVCYYEKENDWWVSKQIKKPIRSTVTSIDWHPNNVLIAAGACDFKEVDEKPSPNPWGTKMPFGNLMAEYSNGGGGWVHSVKFSPSGCRLSWVGHDSSVSVVDANEADKEYQYTNGASSPNECKAPSPWVGSISTVKEWYLPFTSVEWVTENSLVAVGHDCCPMLFTYDGPNQLKFVSKLDVPSEHKSGNANAMARFKTIASKGDESVSVAVKTLHQNTISQLCIHSGTKASVTKFSTSGIDGLLILWDLKALESQVASIKVS